MKRELLQKSLSMAVLLLAAVMWTATTALAQDYGVGETINVPQTPGTTPIDGIYEADFWDTGATLDLMANTDFWSEDFPDPGGLAAEGKVLYVQDSLYIYVTISGDDVFFAGRGGDHILLGIDPIHEAGNTDELVDDDFAGWPENAPDQGPHAYVIYGGEAPNFTLSDGTDAVDEGWIRGEVWSDEENDEWGFEAVVYAPGVATDEEIGFNIGGGTTTEEAHAEIGDSYGYFSQWSVQYPGGDVMHQTSSYGTLRMGFGSEGYGGGVVRQVPRVDPGVITIDGNDDEAAWEDAQSDIEVTANWNSYGWGEENAPEPDLLGETKLLWSEDTLYVHHRLFDPILFWQEDNPWGSDMILIGIDNSLEGDTLFGPGFDGGIHNAPEGVYTYFVSALEGFTFAWNDSVAQRDPGTVNGVVYVDEDNSEWGIEAAIYVPAIEEGAQIGFDIGGAQASQEQQDSEGFGDYAYYAWQSGTGGADPGLINRDASQWATLTMEQSIAIEDVGEVPERFALEQNYPNPFNPVTTIEYAITRPGSVQLEVYNLLGKRVATLVDEAHSTGTYRMRWNADGFSSGIYIYQLRIDGELVDTKSMTLLK